MRYDLPLSVILASILNSLYSETGPTEGTLRVFPDVLLSNAYLILRPFFSTELSGDDDGIFDAKNWKFGQIRINSVPMALLMTRH